MINPPIAPQKPKKLTLHKHERVDPFYWINERTNPEVRAYIEAENEFTSAGMKHTSAMQETLYAEMLGRIQETDQDVPERRGEYEYYTRTQKEKPYKIYCRQKTGNPATEEILIDLNDFVERSDYVKLGVFKPSPDHRLLAFSLDLEGGENYTVYFKDLSTGDLLPDELSNTGYAGEWANDNKSYFFTTKDDAWRDYRLFRYKLGMDNKAELLYEEADALFGVHVSKTRDQTYLVLSLESIKTREHRILNANFPEGSFTALRARSYGIEYGIDHRDGRFYIWTNEDAFNFKLVSVQADQVDSHNWQEFIAHNPEVKIDSVDCFEHHLAIYQRKNGLRSILIYDFKSNQFHQVSFPEVAYSFWVSENPEFNTCELRFNYYSPVTPDSIIDYDMDSKNWNVRKRKPVLGGYDPENYVVERVFARAGDGASIPITLLHKKGLTQNGENPCLLYGYGSYGYSNEPRFNMNFFSLVDRGFILALSHIRGGGEMGQQWYENGKFLNKKNTFTDFINCGRMLVDKNYTRPEQMAIMGRSAGGLLIGAVVNMAPDLCKAAVAHVPFVDVVTTMLDNSIPLTVGEFEEWGNPLDEAYYWYMLSYSPYDNVEEKTYPHLLVTSGLNDPRVQYWEPTKWVAKLRATGHGPNRLFLRTNMGAGHSGPSGRYDYLRDEAFTYAFILDSLGFQS